MVVSQIRGIFLFASAFLNIIFTLLLWLKGKRKTTFYLGWVALFSAVYAFTYGGAFFFEGNKSFWVRATWLGVLILPAYITFVYDFTERTKHLHLKSFFWYLGAVILSYLSFATPYIEKTIISKYPYVFAEEYGPLAPIGRIYIIVCLAISFFYLLNDYFKSYGFKKLQLKYFILGISIYTMGGMFTAGVTPLFYPGFTYIDISAFLSIFWVGLTTYAILKKELFEIKIILTEILVGIMGVILAILPFLMPTNLLRVLNLGIFFLFCIFGYFLIKGMYNEIRNKERAEKFKITSIELKEKLVPTNDIEYITSLIGETLVRTFQIRKIGFAIKEPTGEFYEIWSAFGFDTREIGSFIAETELCAYIKNTARPLILERLPLMIETNKNEIEKIELKQIYEKMKKSKISVLFPLFQKKILAGILFLGEKNSGMPFTDEEIDLLECLSYQIAVSINNTLLFREIVQDKDVFERMRERFLERWRRIEELKRRVKELEERLKEKG